MKKLIEAFTIFDKYNKEKYPLWGDNKSIYVLIDPTTVSEEDTKRLNELGFSKNYQDGACFEVYLYKAEAA